jgi:hypothetical protein
MSLQSTSSLKLSLNFGAMKNVPTNPTPARKQRQTQLHIVCWSQQHTEECSAVTAITGTEQAKGQQLLLQCCNKVYLQVKTEKISVGQHKLHLQGPGLHMWLAALWQQYQQQGERKPVYGACQLA